MSKPKHEGADRAKPPAQGPGDGQDEIIDNRSPPTIASPIRARRAYFSFLLFIISSQVIRQKVRQADDRAKPEDHHDPVKQDLAAAAAGLRSESGVGRARCLWRRAGQSGVLGHVSSLHEHALAACKAGGGSDGQARGVPAGRGAALSGLARRPALRHPEATNLRPAAAEIRSRLCPQASAHPAATPCGPEAKVSPQRAGRK